MGVPTSLGGVSHWSIQSYYCQSQCWVYQAHIAVWSPHCLYSMLTNILVWTGSKHTIWQDHPSQNTLPSRPYTSSHISSSIELITLQQLTDHELLTLHSEVLALQEKLSISYKDALHWLYTCKIEKLALADANHRAFKNLDSHLKNTWRRSMSSCKFIKHLAVMEISNKNKYIIGSFCMYQHSLQVWSINIIISVHSIYCCFLRSIAQNFTLPHILPKCPGPFHGILVYSCSFPGVLVCSCFVLVHSYPIPNLEKNYILIRFLSWVQMCWLLSHLLMFYIILITFLSWVQMVD